MNPRLVICLLVSALFGVGSAAFSVVSGFGVLVALVAYSGTSSVSLLALAVATMPRARAGRRAALLPAPGRHTVA